MAASVSQTLSALRFIFLSVVLNVIGSYLCYWNLGSWTTMLVHRRRLSLRVSGCLTMFFCKEQHRSSRCRRQSSSPRRYGDTVSKCCYDLSISSRYADAEVGAFVFRPLDFAKLDSVVPVVCLFVLMIFSHVVILKTHTVGEEYSDEHSPPMSDLVTRLLILDGALCWPAVHNVSACCNVHLVVFLCELLNVFE